MEKLYSAIAETAAKNLKEYKPYPKASDRTAWTAIGEDTARRLVEMGEAFAGYDFPQILATDFMRFKRTGNRVDYESKLFGKRRALNALVLAECAEYRGRFLDDIINGIYAICLEPAWQLPAHNSYIRDTPQLILPDVANPVVELFACEAAAVLAVTYYLLKDELDAVSPFICSLIEDAIDQRVISPYLTRHFWWMGRGDEPMNNWTVWCTQNVLIAAFLTPHEPSVREQIVKKAAGSCDYFLKDYGEDGCCDEGAQYYRHAGLCLFLATEVLNEVTGGAFSSVWDNEKIKNIAMYIVNMHVDGPYYLNFADCSPVAGRCGVREYLFGRRCHLPELALFAAKDYAAEENSLQPQEQNLFYRLMEVFTRDEMLHADTSAVLAGRNIYYPSVGIFVLRGKTVALAVKSGDNDDSHNHNDTGSITVYKDGQPFLVDIGVESYTQKTFSAQRYELWTLQSQYHNLPTVNGALQQAGPEYAARVIDCRLASDGGFFEQDIAGAYPKDAGIQTYVRRVDFDRDIVTVTDTWNPGCDVVQNFITYGKPQVLTSDGQSAVIAVGRPDAPAGGCLAEAAAEGGCPAAAAAEGLAGNDEILGTLSVGSCLTDASSGSGLPEAFTVSIEELPITDARLQICWKHSLYRIQITYRRDVTSSKVTLFG